MAEVLRAAEKVARMEGQVENIDRDLREHLQTCAEAHKEIGNRFGKLERIVWQASGAVAVIVMAAQVIGKH